MDNKYAEQRLTSGIRGGESNSSEEVQKDFEVSTEVYL
jgi:hypothetical protein